MTVVANKELCENNHDETGGYNYLMPRVCKNTIGTVVCNIILEGKIFHTIKLCTTCALLYRVEAKKHRVRIEFEGEVSDGVEESETADSGGESSSI